MEEQRFLTQDDVLDLIGTDTQSFPYEPMFNKVIVTLNREIPDGNLILSDNMMSEEQFVVAVGPTAQVKAGQRVLLDLEKMMVSVKSADNDVYEVIKQIKIDPIEVDNTVFAIIEDRYIKCKIKG